MQKYQCAFDRKGECGSKTPDADGFCTQAEHCRRRNDHCKTHWLIPDTANGEAVAVLVAGIHLNSYGTCKEFVETMLQSEPAVRFNFSRLAVDWFAIQQNNIYHDKRNVDSFQFANLFCSEFQSEPPAYRRPRKKVVPELLDVVYRDGAQVAGAMDAYLHRGFGDGYQDFLRRLQYEHPTLQQCYTRMCCEWFSRLADTPELAHGAERRWAKMIKNRQPRFRFI